MGGNRSAGEARSLFGCLPGDPSLIDDLMEERRFDRELEEARLAQYKKSLSDDATSGRIG